MAGVVDGQAVNQTVTNAAFIFKNADDSSEGKLELNDTDPVSGAAIENLQREHNSIASFAGKAVNADEDSVPTYTNDQGFTPNDPLLDRLDDVSGKFHNTTGHAHTGASGDAPQVDVLDLSGLQLLGYAVKGTDLTAVTGGSTDVSTELTGETPSTNDTIEGVVVSASQNYIHIFDENGDSYLDGTGNKVYGRLTESTGVWTLTYYSNIAGVETAYTFSGSNDVQWYYQKLFNESNRPVYSDAFVVASDQVAGEIPNASTSVRGKVLLSNSAAAAIGTTGTIGTQNGTVANADHTHAGVASVAKSGDTALTGTVTLTGTGAVTLTQTGQNIEVNVGVVTGGITELTSDVTAGPGSGSQAATIAANAVTNTKLADMATQTIKGRTTAGSGDPEDLTAAQATDILNNFVGDSGSGGDKGLVPAPASGDAAANKYLKADGTWATIVGGGAGPRSMVRVHTTNNFGSTNTKIFRFTTTVSSTGPAITFSDSDTLGSSWAINEDGIYTFSASIAPSSSTGSVGFSLNSTQLTTDIDSITAADRLSFTQTAAGAAAQVSTCWTGILSNGDVVRLHAQGGTAANDSTDSVTAVKVSN